VLVPDSVAADSSGAAFQQVVLNLTGAEVGERRIVDVDLESDTAVLQSLGDQDWSSGAGLLVLFEAWMPPIDDNLQFLRDLRNAVGERVSVTVGLLGKPAETVFAPPRPEDVRIWKQRTAILADPWLLVSAYNEKEVG
jgi:hypothetical protein